MKSPNSKNSVYEGKQSLFTSDRSLKIREWMTTAEAAEYLRVTVGALRNMTSSGLVPYRKLGNRNRYSAEELRTLLSAQKRGSNGY